MLGKRIGGRYELLSVVGGGGMAVVYKARDVILDRVVAVKVLRPEFSNDDEFIRRFRREAQSVTSLFDPNIVNIYDVGDNTDENGNEDDIYYIVMQYVEGETLKDLIKREAPLPLGQALHIMDQITSAIEHAHEQNIVHRDIKPQNILIDHDGEAKVTDFGIAIAMSSATITHTNSVIGSAHYFSPEQARGGYANTRSDIYSLGIVMFEMLTGELPFSGTSPVSVALKHLQEDIPDPRELNPAIPQSVENIILKALSKDPNHRYETVETMRNDLKTALDPDRLNEPKFMAPDEEGETTKIMAPVMGASVNESDNGGNGGPNSGDSGSGSGDGPKKKKGKTKKLLWILLLLLLLIGGAAVSAFTIMPDILSVDSVKMPKVVGMDIGKARNTLKHKGLKVRSEKVSSSKYDKGKVVRQNPAAHTLVKKKTFVNLYVSKGPKKVSLDNYIGMDKDTARLILNESNFKKVSFQSVHSDTYVKGMVMKQSPAPGTRVAPENTKLVLTYSSGPKSVEIPDLTGYTKEGAQNLLEDRGLTPDFQEAEYSDTIEEGQVTRQSPDPGTEVDPGGTVEFWVSKGPQPKPTPEPPTGSGSGSDSGSGTTGEDQSDPITFQQPITVQMPDHKGNGKGKPVHVKIVYSDANHDQQTFKEEDIHETKQYDLQMTVAPDGQVEVWVYVDKNLQDHFTKTYQQVQDETGGNG